MTTLAELTHLAVFDIETTGVNTEQDRVVTAFIGVMNRDGVLTNRYEWLVNPGIPIPDAAAEIHGISTAHAIEHGLSAAGAVADIVDTLKRLFVAGIPVTAYNAPYDLTLIDREARRHGVAPFEPDLVFPVIDPFVIDKATDQYRRGSRKLVDVATQYGVPFDDAHNAEADAVGTGRLAWKILDQLNQAMTLEGLHATQVNRKREQAANFQDHLRKTNPLAYVEGQWPFKRYDAEEHAPLEAV
jgi:DNA polymerase-3 subunit epsilon